MAAAQEAARSAAAELSTDVCAYAPQFCLDRVRAMVRIRRLEERCAQLHGETAIRGLPHQYIGEEAVAAGVMPNLQPQDNVVATYREHGHALLRGVPMNAIMAEMFGKQEGCSRGRGGPTHLFDRSRRFHGGNPIAGGGLPLAVGLALADSMSGRRGCVTACFFGEGAVAEGAFHESLNLAALWQVPVLFICENNLNPMGTAPLRSQSQIDLTFKAASYGLPTAHINGMNVLAVHEAAHRAIGFVRERQTPFFLELHTYRFRAHSTDSADEVERWKRLGPIRTLTDKLKAAGLMSEAAFQRIDREALDEVEAAVAFARAGTLEPPEQLTDGVHTPRAAAAPGGPPAPSPVPPPQHAL
jgi:pyruvate dehydrogenase E1 component alpha subunit